MACVIYKAECSLLFVKQGLPQAVVGIVMHVSLCSTVLQLMFCIVIRHPTVQASAHMLQSPIRNRLHD